MNILRAFLLVTFASFKNKIAVRIKRLRNPRYLVSTIAGLAYFWFMVFRRSNNAAMVKVMTLGGLHIGELGRDITSIFIFAVLLFPWAAPQQSGGVELSEAEIGFLFAAPLSRAQILLYKLFRSIPSMLISVFFITMFGFRQAKVIGLLVGFGVLTVYMMMVGQARARLKLARIGFLIRAVAVVAAAIGFGALFLHAIGGTQALPLAMKAFSRGKTQAALDAADAPFHHPVIAVLLFLPKVFAGALFPATNLQLLISILALLVFGYLCFLVAARVSVSFEEASMVVSQRRLERQLRMQGRRAGRQFLIHGLPPPFRLSPMGPPEVAIIWKNVTAALRMALPAILIIGVIFGVNMIQGFHARDSSLLSIFTVLGLCYSAAFPFFGTAVFTQDLRLDLPRIELLKGYPISGERLVAAELAAPLAIVSVLELMFLTGAAILASRLDSAGPLRLAADPKWITLALLFTIPLIGAQLVIRNAAPILLPAWALRSKEDVRGFVLTGQRLVMLLGNLILLALVLVPAFLLFLPALLLANHYFAGNPVALALASVPSVAVLTLEVFVGVKVLGAQFEKIDVTNDLDPVSA